MGKPKPKPIPPFMRFRQIKPPLRRNRPNTRLWPRKNHKPWTPPVAVFTPQFHLRDLPKCPRQPLQFLKPNMNVLCLHPIQITSIFPLSPIYRKNGVLSKGDLVLDFRMVFSRLKNKERNNVLWMQGWGHLRYDNYLFISELK